MAPVQKTATKNAWLNQAIPDLAGWDLAGRDNANRYKSFGLLENIMNAAMVKNGEKTKKTSSAPCKVFDMPKPPKIL